MASRPTPAVVEQIVGYILAGGYPHIAAEASGVPAEQFRDWLERGQRPGAREPYRSFNARVREAIARARLKAEVEFRDKEPKYWLCYGPGRDQPDFPGWSASGKGYAGPGKDVGLPPGWRSLLEKIWAALEPFPEARAALREVLAREEQPDE